MVYVGTIHPHHLSAGKLFMKSRKNVLIEKPLAMNSREVQELITAAQKDNVFLMEVTFFFSLHQNNLYHSPNICFKPFCVYFQAIWTRFFPASLGVRRLLSGGEVGDVRLVRADLGAPLTHIARLAERKMGGGALLDLGIYCLQFVFMVFNGERPESIQATGHCIDTGEESVY